ncbi:MAG: hypothetical protein FJY85_12190 [Deltaproteobacteria bacterium]|nr:hypothetical protein [Deltaproteobacteria bacterium]
MDFVALWYVTVLYVASMLLGLVWVVYRVWHYRRAQKDREYSMSAVLLSEDQFRAYLENLKGNRPSSDETAATQDTDSSRHSG